MHQSLQRIPFGKIGALLLLALAAAGSVYSQERADCHALRSAILHTSVRYCVFLPANYSAASAKAQRYPVLYLLHGLGGNEQTMAIDGEWSALQDLRGEHKVGDFLVVAPDGWDTFYINSRDGKTLYGDFLFREFIPLIERSYRIRAGRASRGITGFSMGGYGALRIAFATSRTFRVGQRSQRGVIARPAGRRRCRGIHRKSGRASPDRRVWKSDRQEILGVEQPVFAGAAKTAPRYRG